MKKLNKCGELLWVLGTLFIAFGVAICDKANLGVSMVAAPAFVVAEALGKIFPFITVGVTEYLLQGVLLIILCLILRKFNWVFLLSFVVAFIYGYVLDNISNEAKKIQPALKLIEKNWNKELSLEILAKECNLSV